MTDINNPEEVQKLLEKNKWKDPDKIAYDKAYDDIFYALCAEGKTLPEISYIMSVPFKKFEIWKESDRNKSFARAYESGMVALEAKMIENLQKFKMANLATAAKTQLEELKRWFPDWNVPEKREQKNIDPLKNATNEEIDNKALFALEQFAEQKEKLKAPPDLKVIDGNKSRKA